MVGEATKDPAGRRRLLVLALAVALGCGAGGGGPDELPQETRGQVPGPGASAPATPGPGIAWVVFGTDTVHAEVARTPDERSRGLMYREDLPGDTGMLFVWPESDIRSFWMQNTFVALDIAFLDAEYRIVDIQQMEPESEDFHRSRAPAMFALEVPMGWFAEHGVEVGELAEVVFGP